MAKYKYGFPKYGDIDDADELILANTLTSATDIPNAANANIGSNIEFDSVNGMRAVQTGADATQRILYDGPYPAAGAWSARDVELATNRGFTIQFEVHRDAFDIGATGLAGTGTISPLHFRAASNVGLSRFGRGGVSGDTTYETSMGTNHPGFTSATGYCSQWANDKEIVPVFLCVKRGKCNVYVDGYHAVSWPATAWLTTDFNDLRLGGVESTSNSTPPGFPYWIRNLQIMNRRLSLPVHRVLDRLTGMGDSLVSQGDYHIGSPRYNASHPGTNADAGHTPMLERLMAREGYFTSDIHNTGEVGARLSFVSGGKDILSQLNGTPTNVHTDARTSRGKHCYVIVGTNDAASQTTTIDTTVRASLNTFLDLCDTEGFEHIHLCNVPDCSGWVSATNSPAVTLARLLELNAMYAEEAALRDNVHVVDLYSELGAYGTYAIRSDGLHWSEETHARVARLIWASIRATL
jgi:lysophospholipase L1-like esterase